MVVCNAIQFIHVDSKDNDADILTKSLPKTDHYRLADDLLRRKDPSTPPLTFQRAYAEKSFGTG
jgi:hypothetical protein